MHEADLHVFQPLIQYHSGYQDICAFEGLLQGFGAGNDHLGLKSEPMIVDSIIEQLIELGTRSSAGETETVSRSNRVWILIDEEICCVLRLKHVLLELCLACNLGRNISVISM